MKKVCLLLLSLLLSISFSSCAASDSSSENSSDSLSSSEASSSDSALNSDSGSGSVSHKDDMNSLTDARIKELAQENLNCFLTIFEMSSLPIQGEPLYGTIYQVDQAKFSSYSVFEDYIRSIYVKTEADRLLKNYPIDGNPKYLNENGKLCLDISLDAGGGYNVDWTGYKFEKSSVSSNRCDLTLCAVSEEPGENTVAEYKVSVTLQYENGKWLLAKMFS